MKKIIKAVLKSAIGKAVVELLLSAFLQWLEKNGYQVYRNTSTGAIPQYSVNMKALTDKFCQTEVDKL